MRPLRVRHLGVVLALACAAGPGSALAQEQDPYLAARERMVAEQLAAGLNRRPITDLRVLKAMRSVPRHLFVPSEYEDLAYTDQPLPLADGQTISQPYIVALMTELAEITRGDRVLEIGTGSGYQAAVLASLTDQVYSIEIIDELAKQAERVLTQLHYTVNIRVGDGNFGWPEAAPFNAILVTAAAPRVPPQLARQLADGGRLVIPVGETFQTLYLFRKGGGALSRERVIPVRFVPMTGAIDDAPEEP